jgi:hypothetical protein
MTNIEEKIGIHLYNYAIRKRNYLVNNREQIKKEAVSKGRNVLGYLTQVGTNITNDMTTHPEQMFPFQLPKEQQHRKKRNHKRNTNPYTLF